MNFIWCIGQTSAKLLLFLVLKKGKNKVLSDDKDPTYLYVVPKNQTFYAITN